MPYTMSSEIEIAAPPDRVFAALSDVEQMRAWMPNLVALEPLTQGPLGVGSQWRETRKMMGHQAAEVFEVTALEPPRRLEVYVDGAKGTTGKGAFRFRFDLEPISAGTRVKMNGEVDMPGGWLTWLTGRLVRGVMKTACQKDLKAMKAHVERGH